MSILKPQKILFKELRKVDNLLEEHEERDEIENITIDNYKKEKIEITNFTIRKAVINKIELTN